MKNETHEEPHTVLIKCKDKNHLVDMRDIIFIEACKTQSCIYMRQGSINDLKIIVCKNLKQMEEQLPANEFFRCHDSYIIALKFIKEHRKTGKQCLLLTDNHLVPVSRKHAKELIAVLESRSYTNSTIKPTK